MAPFPAGPRSAQEALRLWACERAAGPARVSDRLESAALALDRPQEGRWREAARLGAVCVAGGVGVLGPLAWGGLGALPLAVLLGASPSLVVYAGTRGPEIALGARSAWRKKRAEGASRLSRFSAAARFAGRHAQAFGLSDLIRAGWVAKGLWGCFRDELSERAHKAAARMGGRPRGPQELARALAAHEAAVDLIHAVASDEWSADLRKAAMSLAEPEWVAARVYEMMTASRMRDWLEATHEGAQRALLDQDLALLSPGEKRKALTRPRPTLEEALGMIELCGACAGYRPRADLPTALELVEGFALSQARPSQMERVRERLSAAKARQEKGEIEAALRSTGEGGKPAAGGRRL